MRLVVSLLIMGALAFLSTGLLFYPDGWSEVAHIAMTTLGCGLSFFAGCWYFVRGTKPDEPPPPPIRQGRVRML